MWATQLEVLATAFAAAVEQHGTKSWPANPFPRGVRTGSVTDRVLAELTATYPGLLNHGQLMQRCNASRGAVSWAVAYLEEHRMIQSTPDGRQSNYKRYRLVPEPSQE